MKTKMTVVALSALFCFSTGAAMAAADPAVNADPHSAAAGATEKKSTKKPKARKTGSSVRSDAAKSGATEIPGQGDVGNAGMGSNAARVEIKKKD